MKAIATALLMALLPAAAAVQAADAPPRVGDMLRAYLGDTTVEGALVASDGTTLMLKREDGSITLPAEAVTRLEVRRDTSRGRNVGTGAIVGAGVGMVAGAIWVGGLNSYTPAGAGMLGAPGSALGVLVGLLLPTTNWRPVDTKGLRVSLVPVSRGAELRLAVSF